MLDSKLQKTARKSSENYIPIQVLNPLEAAKHYTYKEYKPSSLLDDLIENYWIMRWNLDAGKSFTCQIISSPYVALTCMNYGAQVTGVTTGVYNYEVRGEGVIYGVLFKPGGFYPFCKHSVSELTNKTVPAAVYFETLSQTTNSSILLAKSDKVGISILEKLLLLNHPQPDAKIKLINEMISTSRTTNMPEVSKLAKEFSISERQLQALFKKYVGVGLKWIILRNKLQLATNVALHEKSANWTQVALDLGYSDHSHFINDFKRIIGKTPTQYANSIHNAA